MEERVSFYLAVDAGGTKTEYLLGNDTHELARVRTGTIKRMRTDDATATRNLETGLAQLSASTRIAMQTVTSTCVGAAGCSVSLVGDWIRAAFAQRVGGALRLTGDVDIALDAAFSGGPGVVVIAGTGSNVAGRGIQGAVTTVGGWGPVLSDQISGHRVGLQGLRALFLTLDEEQPTNLLDAVLERWQLRDCPALVEYANRLPAPDFSELAPIVVACARQGDRTALAVLDNEAEEMAHLVHVMIARLRRSGADATWLPEVAFAGSMMEHVPLLREAFIAALRKDLPHLPIREGVVDPLSGALWRARQQAGRGTDPPPATLRASRT